MKKQKSVVITTMPIAVPAKDAFECAMHDRVLIDCICKYADELRGKGVEVFKREKNIIATSDGYFCAFYEDDLETMEKDPLAFKGKDGRMKVELRGKDGEQKIEDLATLVAIAFIPNPGGFTFVDFKDGNPENTNADNLFWTEKKKEE